MSNVLGDLQSVEYNILKKDWETEDNTNEFGVMIRFDFQIYETKGYLPTGEGVYYTSPESNFQSSHFRAGWQ